MSRITSRAQLEHLGPYARAQVERAFEEIEGQLTPAELRLRVDAHPSERQIERPEEEAGRMLVTYMDYLVLPNGLKPGLFFYHVPNGLARNATEGGIFQAQGLRKDFPDYVLALPLGRFPGLYLELKRPDGEKPGPGQLEVLHRLEVVGYKVCVAWGFDDAKRQLDEYLDLAR